MKMTGRTITAPEDYWQELEALAKSRNTSVSAIVRRLIEIRLQKIRLNKLKGSNAKASRSGVYLLDDK